MPSCPCAAAVPLARPEVTRLTRPGLLLPPLGKQKCGCAREQECSSGASLFLLKIVLKIVFVTRQY